MRALAVVAALVGCGSASPAKIDKGFRVTYSLDLDAVTDRKAAVADAVRVLTSRFERGHVTGTVQSRGEILVVDLAATDRDQLDHIRELIGRTGRLEVKVVDSGAPVMQQVYNHVLQDRDADRIGARSDEWVAPGGTHHIDYYLTAPERPMIEKYVTRLRQQDATWRIPDDRQLGFERIELDPREIYWRTYLLERTVRLGNRDITNARPALEPSTGRPTVWIDLADTPARDFGKLTAGMVGQKIALILDDRVVSAPIVAGAIDRGRITLATDDPKQLAIVLASGALPTPLREETFSQIDGDHLITIDENGQQIRVPR